MAYAVGVSQNTYLKIEGVGGTLDPAVAWIPLRLITNGLSQSVEELESDEMLPGRHMAESRSGVSSVAGDLEAELTYGTFDMLLEAAFHGTWQVKTRTASTLSVAAADDSFNDSASGFVTAGFAVGDVIKVSGFATAANNGQFKVASVAAGKITVTDLAGAAVTLVDELAGASVTIATGGTLKTGSTSPLRHPQAQRGHWPLADLSRMRSRHCRDRLPTAGQDRHHLLHDRDQGGGVRVRRRDREHRRSD